jgi:glycine betaine/proline transport system permease protein
LTAEVLPIPRLRNFRWGWVVGAGIVVLVALNSFLSRDGSFPTEWNLGLAGAINQFRAWAIQNQLTHPLFTAFFGPISDVIGWGLRTVENFLLEVPWFVLTGLVAGLATRSRGLRAGLLAALGMLYFGVTGLWDASVQTLALMGVSVTISLLIGIPVGIWAARRPAVEKTVRPFLDAMQTMPAFVYLIPVLLFFGIGGVPAVVATVVYALPPSIRLTTLGLRQVPVEAVEASRIFGATSRQTLTKVEVPLAMPAILAAINQTVVLALGIVVIAALIGARGLGLTVVQSLQSLRVGHALEAGIAIVILAILLDRIGSGFARQRSRRPTDFRLLPVGWQRYPWARTVEASLDRAAKSLRGGEETITRLITRPLAGRPTWRAAISSESGFVAGALVLLSAGLIGWLVGADDFPRAISFSYANAIDSIVAWLRDNIRWFTTAVSRFLVINGTKPLRALFETTLAWPVVIGLVVAIAWWAAGRRVAFFSAAGLLLVGLLGTWSETMDTLSQVIVAVGIALLLAIPLGVLAARFSKLDRGLQPIYDGFQTIPSFVFLVPVVILFGVGRIPGIIASVLYAFPPGARLTTLGLRQVPEQTVEASTVFGATPAQTLRKVQAPIALPTIMAGVNQVVMLTLAMVVIAGLVGGEGLGLMVVTGFRRARELGVGFEGGISIIILAMILDRITQGWSKRLQPTRAPTTSVSRTSINQAAPA